MALYVNTNVSSINGQRNLAKSTRQLDGVYQKLSSGFRINSAKDDAAGLQIADRMTVQIDGLTQGNRNANDGISICQTMEGALDEITSMLERIRTLAVQSANGSNSSDEREALQQEVSDLTSEILRIGAQTTYGKNLYCFNANPPAPGSAIGQNGKITFHIGAYKDNTVDVNYRTLSGILGAGLNDLYPVPQTSALTTTMLDQQLLPTFAPLSNIEMTTLSTSNIVMSTLTGSNFSTAVVSWSTAAITDVNLNTLTTDNIAMTTLSAANITGGTLTNITISDISRSNLENLYTGSAGQLSVNNFQNAEDTIENVDNMLKSLDSYRAELGAAQNRFESSISNQENIIENVSDARSRIRDVDYAAETAKMAQLNILQQAATSILTQANQKSQTALSLLGQ